jgi:hypothetical protein
MSLPRLGCAKEPFDTAQLHQSSLVRGEPRAMNVFSYWSGPTTWMERLSVASALATGHDITVFTHDDRAKLASSLGCRVIDAKVIADDPTLEDLRRRRPDAFSDHFRLEGIVKGSGVWTDLDVVFLKTLPADSYLFGWQNKNRVGNSILGMPSDSELLTSYITFCRKRPMVLYAMPWFPWHLKLGRSIKGIVGNGPLGRMLRIPEPAPKYGPTALTHFVKKCGMSKTARPSNVFYPIPIRANAISGILNDGAIEQMISPETVSVHLWRSTYLSVHGPEIPKSGWIAKKIKELSSRH